MSFSFFWDYLVGQVVRNKRPLGTCIAPRRPPPLHIIQWELDNSIHDHSVSPELGRF